jgi:hypothetical protein
MAASKAKRMTKCALPILLAALGLMACGSPVLPARLSVPARAEVSGLSVTVSEVRVSPDVFVRDMDERTRVLVVIELRSERSRVVDLRELQLTIGGARNREPGWPPISTGVGDPPELLRDGSHAKRLVLEPGRRVRAWVAFGGIGPRRHQDIEQRVELSWPGGDTLVLADPGRTEPWRADAKVRSFGYGFVWVQLSADESAVNGVVAESRWLLDPVMVTTRYGLGARPPEVCCNLAIGMDAGLPIVVDSYWQLAPYAGVEGALLLGDSDVKREDWWGAALGVEASMGHFLPRSGPFPIVRPATPLGIMNVRLALVNWFGDHRAFPSLGMSSSISLSL